MVLMEGNELNSLFEELEAWERYLAMIDPKGLECDDGPDFTL
jgi:hypothetical protein